ncbi:MAG: bifunctional DNA-formamidopyrimidine glycosylase/DNA-(apurinic or apyrimidinic site) lyase [Patescibacteria group bacterium]|jgi:formamidopyrimidine-DNA glycosylase
MPELPEVETIAGDLNRKVKGAVISGFWTDWKKAVKIDLAKFKKAISGKKILEVKRRGKNLLFYLSGKVVMHVHLKMTGHLLVKSSPARTTEFVQSGGKLKVKSYFNEKVNQYIHHIWFLKKGKKNIQLEFSDLRKFAKIRLLKADELEADADLGRLGAEPLADEFTLKKFREILKKKEKWAVRDILMEQSLIAGIGNIYVSEILFEAGIMPKRRAKDLENGEIKKVYLEIKNVLKKAVKLRGTSDSDYRDTDGAPGGFQEVLKVYNREGAVCQRKNCRGIVKREKHKQRSSFFCEGCQK